MKTIKFLAIAAVAAVFAFTSCSGGNGGKIAEVDVTVDNTTIGGKLSQYFTLEDKPYKLRPRDLDFDGLYEVPVELKCIEPLPEDQRAKISLDILDQDGTIISAGNGRIGDSDNDKLRQASPGQTVIITILFDCDKDVYEKAVKIRLSSIVKEVEEETSSSSSVSSGENSAASNNAASNDATSNSAASSSLGEVSESVKSSSSSGSQDWNALLNSYEQYVDKYISFAKKAANGDMSAMSEYPALMEKAREFSNKLSGAQGEMSASQWARYMKITSKMTQAAAAMR